MKKLIPTPLNQLNLLIVDDEFIAREVLASFLSEITQKEIQTASNGLEALEILKNHPIDLILTDINMPHMNGIELTETIRASHAHYKNIPILGITANHDPTLIHSAQKAGIHQLLIKPVTQEQLVNILTQLISV